MAITEPQEIIIMKNNFLKTSDNVGLCETKLSVVDI